LISQLCNDKLVSNIRAICFDWVLLPRRWFSGGADVQSFNATINMPTPFNHEKVEVFRNRNHSDYYPENIKTDFIDNTILLSSNEPIPRRDDIYLFAAYVKRITRKNLSENQS